MLGPRWISQVEQQPKREGDSVIRLEKEHDLFQMVWSDYKQQCVARLSYPLPNRCTAVD